MLSSSNCLVSTNYGVFNETGDLIFIETRQKLLDLTPDYFVLSLLTNTTYQVFRGDGSQLLNTISINNLRLSYGSTQVICTYNANLNNACLF